MPVVFRSKSEFCFTKRLRSFGSFGAVSVVRHHQGDFAEYVLKEIKLSRLRVYETPTELAAKIQHLEECGKIKQQIDHPNIARVFGSFTETNNGDDEFYFVVMEYCRGGDLSRAIQDAIDTGRPINERRIKSWSRQLMSALLCLHAMGLVHHDIRPKNIFLDSSQETAKLGDFSLTKETQGTSWSYAAPEVCLSKEYTPKCDIWSLGVVIFELANLKRPFPSGDGQQYVAKAICTTRHADFIETIDYSPELPLIVESMLQKDSNQRPTAAELLLKSPFFQTKKSANSQEQSVFAMAEYLQSAVQLGDVGAVRKILSTEKGRALLAMADHGIWTRIPDNLNGDDDKKQHSGDRPIHRACRFGKLEIVKILVEEFCHNFLDVFNNRGGSPLGLAAQEGHLDIVKYFLRKQPDAIDRMDKHGWTPLLCAANTGQLAVVQFLVENGAKIDAKSNEDDSRSLPIHLAAESGNKATVEFLLRKQPDWVDVKNQENDTPLNRAAVGGRLEIAKYLVLERKADIENRGFNDRTPFLQSAQEGHLSVVQFLLEHGANIDVKSNEDDLTSSAIHLAAENGNKATVEFLLTKRPDWVEVKNAEHDTALNRAALAGQFEIVEYLVLKHKANIENRGSLGQTPLLMAAQEGKMEIVEFLSENGANIEAKSTGDNFELLAIHLAAEWGNKATVEFLLEKRPNWIEVKNAVNDTPLNRAALGGKLEIVEYLVLEQMANIENRGFEGRTPFLQAAQEGHLSVVQFLLENGANFDAKADDEGYGNLAIHLAAGLGNKAMVEFLLMQKPQWLEVKNNLNDTPLNRAANGGKLEIVEYLVLEKKANVENRGSHGRTPFLLAAQNGHLAVVHFLLEHGADIDAKSNYDDFESLAIHLAARFGNKEMIEFLLAKRPNWLEVKTNQNDSPLSRAAVGGNLEIVEYLVLEQKANIHSRGFQGRTPLMEAAQNGHLALVDFFLEHGADINAQDDTVEKDKAIHLAAYFGHVHVVELLLSKNPSFLEMPNASGETPLFYAKRQANTDVVKLLEAKGAKL